MDLSFQVPEFFCLPLGSSFLSSDSLFLLFLESLAFFSCPHISSPLLLIAHFLHVVLFVSLNVSIYIDIKSGVNLVILIYKLDNLVHEPRKHVSFHYVNLVVVYEVADISQESVNLRFLSF